MNAVELHNRCGCERGEAGFAFFSVNVNEMGLDEHFCRTLKALLGYRLIATRGSGPTYRLALTPRGVAWTSR